MSDTERDALQKLGIVLAERDIARRENEGLRRDLADAVRDRQLLAADGDKKEKEIERLTKALTNAYERESGAANDADGLQDVLDESRKQIERLKGQLEEKWPNLTHQMRDKLLAVVQAAGVDHTGKWLSEAAIEAIEKLKQEIERLRAALRGILPFAWHKPDCISPSPHCNCGYVEAMKETTQ